MKKKTRPIDIICIIDNDSGEKHNFYGIISKTETEVDGKYMKQTFTFGKEKNGHHYSDN